MRVLQVSSNWPPVATGGAEAYVAALSDRLRGAGHDVAGVTLGVPGMDVAGVVPARPHRLDAHRDAPAAAKVRFHVADLWHPAVRRTLAAAVADFRPDLVHTHVVTGMSVRALALPSALGLPHVHTLHDHWLRCWRSTGTRRSQEPCGPACTVLERVRAAGLRRHGPDVVIAISDAVRGEHARLATSREVRVVRHPADVTPVRRRPRPSGEGTAFGFLGQLNPNKGIGTFLQLARVLDGADVRFVVAGAGRLDDEVVAAAATLPRLEHRGWVDAEARERFFVDIDCLVVPSRWEEPAGLVVREAAARGVPVIAAAVGGLPEYVPSSCRPLLFPAGDVAALEDRIRTFVADPASYAVDPSEVPTWNDHLTAVLDAYAAARGRTPVGV